MGATPSGGGFPSPWQPRVLSASLIQRIGWLFSRTGRVRRRLWRVQHSPDDPKARRALRASLEKLVPLMGSRPEARQVAGAGLQQLCGMSLRQKAADEAIRWLNELDRLYPDMPERVALRWELMVLLESEPGGTTYNTQAGTLFSDVLFGMEAHHGAVLHAIRFLYEELSRAQCREALTNTHPRLREHPEIQAAIALCECPPVFASAQTARDWRARVGLKHLNFSKQMTADALLVAARATEWEGSWIDMQTRSCESIALLPRYGVASYWVLRALLHQAEQFSMEESFLEQITESPHRERLVRLIRLHQDSTLTNAEAVLPDLTKSLQSADPQEYALVLDLLTRALTSETARQNENLRKCAELSAAVGAVDGDHPWIRINVAWAEILFDQKYSEAIERLEKPNVLSVAPASELARISRILAGSRPRNGAPKTSGWLEVFESAQISLFDPGCIADRPDLALAQQVEQARRESVWCRRIPALDATAEVLELALRVAAGDKLVTVVLLERRPQENWPQWVLWLWQVTGLSCGGERFMQRTEEGPVAGAWWVEGWWTNYGGAAGPLPSLAERARSQLDHALDDQPAAVRSFTQALRAVRKLSYRKDSDVAKSTVPREPFPEMGDLPAKVCGDVLRVERDYAHARAVIAAGKSAKEAVQMLRALETELGETSVLVQRMWAPAIRYWLGVAQARHRDNGASETLQTLLDGPCASSARGQLALLSLRDGLTADAEHWLHGADGLVPCVRYATALVHARRGRIAEASEGLESADAIQIFAGSSYQLPAWRLAAALQERCGNLLVSDRLHAAILELHPNDEIVLVRRGRNLVSQAYAQFRSAGVPISRPADLPTASSGGGAATSIKWWDDYSRLQDIIAAPEDALPDLEQQVITRFGVGTRSLVWRQLLAGRFVRARNAARALQILDISPVPTDCPPGFAQARLILLAWHWLPHLAEDSTRTSACERLREYAQALIPLVQAGSDSQAAQWRASVEQALQVESDDSLDVVLRNPPQAMSTHLGLVPLLWSSAVDQRRQAADALLATIGNDGAKWDERQRLLLQALILWTLEKDGAYLESYSVLESMLDELPVTGRDLWLAGALIHFTARNWTVLDGSNLPPCVADMSDPMVRLIIELADARSAADEWVRGKTQSALEKVKRVRENLQDLLDAHAQSTGH